MTKPTDESRRDFLSQLSGGLSSSWLAAQWPLILAASQVACTAKEQSLALKNFEPADGRDIEAIASQIIPTDETPGAREAGVIYFIDEAVGGFMAGAAGMIAAGLSELNATLPDGSRFADLGNGAQMRAMETLERKPLFFVLRFLTLAGMFALPDHGGNENELGWQLLGFDHRHHWQPPFGFYDVGHHSEGKS